MMKNLFKSALLSTIVLLGAASFSACSSSEDSVDNPDYNPDTKSVKTAITLNIGHVSGVTRMADNVTQNDGSFRGMQDVYIYPATAEITATTSAFSAPVVKENTIEAFLTGTTNVKTYSGVEVPTTTSHFLFYGRRTNTASTVDDKLANGFTTPTFPTTNGTAAAIEVAAVPIVGTTYTSDTKWTTPVTTLQAYLNGIATATGWSASTNARLSYLYSEFTKPNQNRAGSASAVLATVQWLYDELFPISSGDAATVATAVINKITDATYVTTSGTGTGLKIDWASTFKTNYETFPSNLGLPSGAAQYQYKNIAAADAEPVYAFQYVPTATLNASNTAVENFVYPNELYYFTMTPLKATPGAVIWPNTAANWQDETWTDWTSTVQGNSKNIALCNNIQYGTAQLATYVKANPTTVGSDAVLYDNAKALDETSNVNKPVIYSDDCFKLTGVIIGAQPTKVGWNFLPTTGATFTSAVYDKNMTSTIYANVSNGKTAGAADYEDGYCGPNNTLVFDNAGASEGTVSVCLEFENLSKQDFYGKDDVIKKGQKFYLIGKLVPSGEAPSMNVPAVYYPSKNNRVFIQDVITKAQFLIQAGGENTLGSLAKAYSTIPDLRTTTQEIGLSVNLSWVVGKTYKNIPLGD